MTAVRAKSIYCWGARKCEIQQNISEIGVQDEYGKVRYVQNLEMCFVFWPL